MAITPGPDLEEFPIPTAEMEEADNAAEIRSALGVENTTASAARITTAFQSNLILQQPKGLSQFFNAVMRTDEAADGSPAFVGITGFSDSMPGYVALPLMMDMSEKIGLAALCSPEFGVSWNGAAATLSGGAAVASTDYTSMPGANEVNIPSGGKYRIVTPDISINPVSVRWVGSGDTDEWSMSAARNQISLPHGIVKVTVLYKTEPGAGSITGTIIQSGLSNVTATADADDALGLATMDLTPTDAYAAMTVDVEAADDDVRMIGLVFWTGESGLLYWSSAKGSTKMDDQLPGLVDDEWNTVYQEVATYLNTKLILHAQRATDAGTEADNYQANYETFFDAYSAMTIDPSQLVFAEPSRDPLEENALTTDEVNAFLASECAIRGLAYFDRKALVPDPSPFQDSPTDGIHRDPRENRYVAGRLVDAFGDFKAAYSRQGPVFSQARLAHERFRMLAANQCRTRQLIGQGGYTYTSQTFTGAGYANPSVNSETGFNFASAAGVAGHSAACFGQFVAGASQLDTSYHDIVFSANGYRNLNLPAGGGHSAALIFGAQVTSITDITAIASRCFGVEFAHGTDIGGGLGAAEYMRIFAHNGTTMTYGRWVLCNTASGVPSANGLGIVLHWDRVRSRLVLWGAGNNLQLFPRTTLTVSALASNATVGAHAHGYIRATGTGHTAGKMQWQHITGTFGRLLMPYDS
jgi:hypothetical protein